MLSRRRFITGGLFGLVTALAAACATIVRSPRPSRIGSQATSTPPSPSPSPVGASLRERIGQMLLVGFRGLTPDEAEPTSRLVADGTIGGVLLFSRDQQTGGPRNVESPEQLRGLIAALAGEPVGPPLLVAIDQEGGQVARLGPAHAFPPTRSAADLGRGDVSETSAAAAEIAATLSGLGITLNLAPVVDLAVNPDNPIIAAVDRSFSADPAVVSAHARAFIESHRAAGVRTAIKHFPGQGSAGSDTHLGIVDVTDFWTDVELEPFRALIDAARADAVLTAHVFNATLDPSNPATLWAATVDGLLRGELGFGGVVISDDLQMGAIRDAIGFDEAVALALEARIDLLLIANQLVYEPDVATRVVDRVERLVRDGRISEAWIDDSYRRILALKGG